MTRRGRRPADVGGRAACVGGWANIGWHGSLTPDTRAEKFESFERINSMRETNGNFYSCNSCKQLVLSRLHTLYKSKSSFVSRVEFIRSKFSNFSAHVSGVADNRNGRTSGGWASREIDRPADMLLSTRLKSVAFVERSVGSHSASVG